MSTHLVDRLPDAAREFFNGADLPDKVGAAFMLVTTDVDGRPRPCMLSAGEVLAQGDSSLRFALWAGTHTGQNLRRGVSALFCFVHEHTVAYLRGIARELQVPHANGADQFEYFEMTVDEADTDEHSGMPVTSGIRYRIAGPDAAGVVADWQRQLAALGRAE